MNSVELQCRLADMRRIAEEGIYYQTFPLDCPFLNGIDAEELQMPAPVEAPKTDAAERHLKIASSCFFVREATPKEYVRPPIRLAYSQGRRLAALPRFTR